MKKQPLLRFLYHLLFSISCAVCGALVLSWPLLLLFMLVQKTNQAVSLSIRAAMHNYNQLMLYLLNPLQGKLHMDNLPTSANAALHFADVKKLFLFTLVIFIIGLSIFLYYRQTKKLDQIGLEKGNALLLMVLPIVVVPFAITNFDSFFVLFHHLLFSNSNWLFDPSTDPIINLLTEDFFASCFACAGLIYELYFAQFLLKK